jgi:hypothetical protein
VEEFKNERRSTGIIISDMDLVPIGYGLLYKDGKKYLIKTPIIKNNKGE